VGKFYPPHLGGIETHVQTLCMELREFVDLEVIVANGNGREERGLEDGVPVRRLATPASFLGAPLSLGMIRAIRRSPADIVHLHLPHPIAVLSYLASGHRGRLVVSYHSDVVRQRITGMAFTPILRRLMGKANAIVAASPNYVISSPILSRFRDRCHVIPYGIPSEKYARRDEAAIAEVRQRYGPRMVLSVGRLVSYKGFEYLVEAMRSVRGTLVVIGEGPLRRSLEERVAAAGLGNRVHLLGGVSDLLPFYQAADVFALASVARSEAFGIVQAEAMAAGTPVVNTALNSGVPFVSIGGVTGLTVEPKNPGAMAEALNRLLDDPSQRAEFGAAARERAVREFASDVMVRRMLGLYESVLGVESGKRPRLSAAGGG